MIPSPSAEPTWIAPAAWTVRRLPAGRFRVIQWLCRRPPPLFVRRVENSLGAFVFHRDLRDSIAREVCFTGGYEPLETALIRALTPRAGVFVDVGANWGYYTLGAAAWVGEGGRVIALEPEPRLRALLQANVSINHFRQVNVLGAAAAQRAGTLLLTPFREDGGNWGVSRLTGNQADGDAAAIPTPAVALDDVLTERDIERVDLLKMDIEGAEGPALRGLKRSLENHVVRWLMLELHPTLVDGHGDTLPGVVQLLRDAGYQLWEIDHGPAATRSAAYARRLAPFRFVMPLTSAAPAGAWPHLLAAAPGIAAPGAAAPRQDGGRG